LCGSKIQVEHIGHYKKNVLNIFVHAF